MGNPTMPRTTLDIVEHPQQLLDDVGTSPSVITITVFHCDSVCIYGSPIRVDVEISNMTRLAPRYQTNINYLDFCRSIYHFIENSYRSDRQYDEIKNFSAGVSIFPKFMFYASFEYMGDTYDATLTSDSITFEDFMCMSERHTSWMDLFRPETPFRPFKHVLAITKRDHPLSPHEPEQDLAKQFATELANHLGKDPSILHPKYTVEEGDGTITLHSADGADQATFQTTMSTTADYIKNMVEPTSPLVEKPQPVELSEEDKQRKMAQQVQDREDLMQAVNNLRDAPVAEDVSEMGEASAITPDNIDIFSTDK